MMVICCVTMASYVSARHDLPLEPPVGVIGGSFAKKLCAVLKKEDAYRSMDINLYIIYC